MKEVNLNLLDDFPETRKMIEENLGKVESFNNKTFYSLKCKHRAVLPFNEHGKLGFDHYEVFPDGSQKLIPGVKW